MTRPYKVVITTGDLDGIGLEVVAKALQKVGPKQGFNFYVWRSPQAKNKYLKIIDSKFHRQTVSSWPEAMKDTPGNHKVLIDIASNLSPAQWVEQSAKAGLYGHVDALATAPLSKTSILNAGFKDIGHTEILRRVTKSEYLFMTFIGEKFSCLIMSGHIPLASVHKELKIPLVVRAIKNANTLKKLLGRTKRDRPVALVGLNPHAGESGILGKEEAEIFAPALKMAREKNIKVEGPLVPDVAYQESQWKKYSIYVAPYHDQALIPFKLVHQHAGLHLTFGLPFIRTSCDHGTAKDIFGKDKADPTSMTEAIVWAMQLAKEKVSLNDEV